MTSQKIELKKIELVQKFLKKSKKFTNEDFNTLIEIKNQNIPLSDNLTTKKEWLQKDFNGWRIIDEKTLPMAWGWRSNFLIKLKNEDGYIKEINNRNIQYIHGNKGNNKTNKKIIPIKKDILLERKFGKLRLIDENLEEFIYEKSKKTYKFICDCGNITEKRIQWVTCGEVKTCGDCRKRKVEKKEMFDRKYNNLRVLTEEESDHNKLLNLPDTIVYSDGFGKNNKLEVICDCGKKNKTGIYDLLSGLILSCGCALNSNRSNSSKLFFDFIKSLKDDAEYSIKNIIKNRELDIYIESIKLNIEYHGCHWHSQARRTEKDKFKDFEKYKLLENIGIRSVQIFSDEWENKKDIFVDYFKDLLKVKEKKRVYKYNFCFISFEEAKNFIDKYHYLSGNNQSGTYYVGIKDNKDNLLSVSIFKKLNNQEIEWKRLCFHPDYKIWNYGEKTINFIKETLIKEGYKKIISFSENRLHTGDVYKKIGFYLEKDLLPDYCYTNGVCRIHKFNFRVKAGINEQEKAKERNFYRLYDCGKKKWVLPLE